MTPKKISTLLALLLLTTAPMQAVKLHPLIIAGCLAKIADARKFWTEMLPLDNSTIFKIEVVNNNTRELFFATNQTNGCFINQDYYCIQDLPKHEMCGYFLDLAGQEPWIRKMCLHWNPPGEDGNNDQE